MRRRGADVVHTEATEQRLGKTRSDAPGTGGVNVGAGEGVEKGVLEAPADQQRRTRGRIGAGPQSAESLLGGQIDIRGRRGQPVGAALCAA